MSFRLVNCSCRLLEGLGGKSIFFGPWVFLTDKENSKGFRDFWVWHVFSTMG